LPLCQLLQPRPAPSGFRPCRWLRPHLARRGGPRAFAAPVALRCRHALRAGRRRPLPVPAHPSLYLPPGQILWTRPARVGRAVAPGGAASAQTRRRSPQLGLARPPPAACRRPRRTGEVVVGGGPAGREPRGLAAGAAAVPLTSLSVDCNSSWRFIGHRPLRAALGPLLEGDRGVANPGVRSGRHCAPSATMYLTRR